MTKPSSYSMVMLVDSREQKPLKFEEFDYFDKVEVVGLPFGDYTVMMDGSPIPLVFERKSIADLWGTMTSGYERFKREVGRAKDHNFKFVLTVEGSYSEVLGGFERSEFSGQSMCRKLNTLWVKYDIETWFCVDRAEMGRRIADSFYAIRANYAKKAN